MIGNPAPRTPGSSAPPPAASAFFQEHLGLYRQQAIQALLQSIPERGPRYLYDLMQIYPRRNGKGLRAALCLATCGALGGDVEKAMNTAVAVELFHNAFLIHDDIQDFSESRRGEPTLHEEHGTPIALNVGNATNLIALQQLGRNRRLLGPKLSWLIFEETQRMLRYSLEGQAIELGWIRDNTCELQEKDYLEMCLKKTSWYSFIYPMRVGALIAEGTALDPDRFCRFGWYLGAAFQIQDDVLNLVGDYASYGKEIAGDLYEGKRTLILIHLLEHCSRKERLDVRHLLEKPRQQRSRADIDRLRKLIEHYGCISHAQAAARQLEGAALAQGLEDVREIPESDDKRFILEMVLYVVNRSR